MCSQSALEDDWDKRNKVFPEEVIRKAIQDGLHGIMHDEINFKDDNYRLVSNERFDEYLETIDHNGTHSSNTHKISQDKLKSSSGSNDDSHSYSEIISKKARKEVKKTSQGEARLYYLFKRVGMPYSK